MVEERSRRNARHSGEAVRTREEEPHLIRKKKFSSLRKGDDATKVTKMSKRNIFIFFQVEIKSFEK